MKATIYVDGIPYVECKSKRDLDHSVKILGGRYGASNIVVKH